MKDNFVLKEEFKEYENIINFLFKNGYFEETSALISLRLERNNINTMVNLFYDNNDFFYDIDSKFLKKKWKGKKGNYVCLDISKVSDYRKDFMNWQVNIGDGNINIPYGLDSIGFGFLEDDEGKIKDEPYNCGTGHKNYSVKIGFWERFLDKLKP